MENRWVTRTERLLEYMQWPAKQKLQWLKDINDFNQEHLPQKTKLIRKQLRSQFGE